MFIGISGRARSGKDTAGTYISQKLKSHGYNVYTTAYANTLKEDLIKNFDLSVSQVHGDLKESPDARYSKGIGKGFWTPREMMQAYGQFMRSIDPDYWVKALFRNLPEADFTILTDLRQPNEVYAVVGREGYHIRMIRDDRPEIADSTHETETALEREEVPINHTVYNNGSLEELYKELDRIIDLIMLIEEDKNGK